MLGKKTSILSHLKKLRENDPARMWRLVGVALGSAVGMAAAVAVVPGSTTAPLTTETVVEQLGTPPVSISRDDPRPFIREDRVRAGESLAIALRRLGVSATALTAQANSPKLTKELSGTFRPGALITVASTPEGGLQSASISAPGSDNTYVIEAANGHLRLTNQSLALESRVHMQGGVVQSSLFAAMDAAGLPDSIAEELSRVFGDDIDFHTDLRKGDRFSVIYEVFYHQGRAIRTGRILAAEFINQGIRHAAYLFTHPNGSQEYYNQDGKSHKEGFLRSPLEFSRVSSGFSMRLHPVLGGGLLHGLLDERHVGGGQRLLGGLLGQHAHGASHDEHRCEGEGRQRATHQKSSTEKAPERPTAASLQQLVGELRSAEAVSKTDLLSIVSRLAELLGREAGK